MSSAEQPVREGSSLYYSLLWTDAEARQRFCDRLSLVNTLATTLDDVQEPQVAEKKIHWWHEELQRLKEGSARHPATIACQGTLRTLDNVQAACLDIVSAAATQRFTPAESQSAESDNLLLSFRARLALLSHALSVETTDLTASTHPDAAALGLAQYEQLARLPALIHRGLPVFSDELYRQLTIRPTDLAKHILKTPQNENQVKRSIDNSIVATNDMPLPATARLEQIPIAVENTGIANLLNHVINRNHTTLSEAIADEAVRQRYRQRSLLPIWRLLVLRERQLDLWNKKQPDLLRERTTLTPLAKLFHAWRHRK